MKPPRYGCHTCAATFTAWAPAERHADAERHHRLELILERSPMPKQSIAKDRRQGEKRMGKPKPSTSLKTPTDPASGRGGRAA